MVQVRCPECGYLQTLSEERFLSIPDNFLHCPHCHARVPKEWAPSTDDAIPEEERHKVLAFSRRILNGGEVGREVVYALEALVRRYGAMESSSKALGMGYAALGERIKAEEFLNQAREEDSADSEVLSCLLETLLAEGKFAEAVRTGKALVEAVGAQVDDEDVARMSLALLGMGHAREATSLLEAHPHLDNKNPVVKQARKQIGRRASAGLGSFFTENNPLNRFLSANGPAGLKKLTLRARSFIGWPPGSDTQEGRPPTAARQPEVTQGRPSQKPYAGAPALVEYWIYASSSNIPPWEDVRESLGAGYPRKADKDRALRLLAALIEKNQLKIEYIVRTDAPDLFHYPEELIESNSPELSEENRSGLLQSEMIVRVRLSLERFSGKDFLDFVVRFVEAVRGLTGGLVQDAISHRLWGDTEWLQHAANPAEGFLRAHIKIDALDEDGTIWMHSHGMQKFGLPDMEIEGIPPELITIAGSLLFVLARNMIAGKNSPAEGLAAVRIPGVPVHFGMEMRPADEEGHFPTGSMRILPYADGYDMHSPDAAKHALRLLQSKGRSHLEEPDPTEETEPEIPEAVEIADESAHLKEKILAAHVRAKNELFNFKKSFQDANGSEGHVYAVKVGFPAEGGQYEWMWVSVKSWRGHSLVGHVENEPVLRTDLGRGSTVHISEEDIFDWVITRSGHVMKGAFTEELPVQ
jgi:uncharacterized protein YegJ (DUF2314 family)